jgi:hypothetical protein
MLTGVADALASIQILGERIGPAEGTAIMTSRRSREGAYADLVAGLLDVRNDPATDRFDAELAAAEEAGRIDPQTAKVLRWWQRESLRTFVEHARVVVPPTLLALEQSVSGADREVEVSARSWARAVGDDDAAERTSAAPPEADDEDGVPPPADLSEHRRRLLVAGLTRVREDL